MVVFIRNSTRVAKNLLKQNLGISYIPKPERTRMGNVTP
jgi:hypothetical protein